MEVNELRIGNWISYRGEKEGYVNNIGCYGLETCRYFNDLPFGSTDPSEYVGIPLNEEWLVRAGFETDSIINQDQDEREFYKLKKSKNTYFYLDDNLQPVDFGIPILNYKLEFVHQLQNLFFALTGSELEFNFK